MIDAITGPPACFPEMDTDARDRFARELGDMVTVAAAMLPLVHDDATRRQRVSEVHRAIWRRIAEVPSELQTHAAMVATSVLLLRLLRAAQ